MLLSIIKVGTNQKLSLFFWVLFSNLANSSQLFFIKKRYKRLWEWFGWGFKNGWISFLILNYWWKKTREGKINSINQEKIKIMERRLTLKKQILENHLLQVEIKRNLAQQELFAYIEERKIIIWLGDSGEYF